MKHILGATAGDIIGSIYEFDNVKTTDFPLFSGGCRATDDSIMTFATMDVLLIKKYIADIFGYDLDRKMMK